MCCGTLITIDIDIPWVGTDLDTGFIRVEYFRSNKRQTLQVTIYGWPFPFLSKRTEVAWIFAFYLFLCVSDFLSVCISLFFSLSLSLSLSLSTFLPP